MSDKTLWLKLSSLLARTIQLHGLKLVQLVLWVLLARFMSVALPIILGEVVNQVASHNLGEAMWLLGLMITLSTISAMLVPWQNKRANIIFQHSVRDMVTATCSRSLLNPLGFFKHSSGHFLAVVEKGINAYDVLLYYFFKSLLPSVIEIALISIYLLYLGGWRALLLITLTTISSLIWLRWIHHLRTSFITENAKHYHEIYARLSEILNAAKTIKIMGAATRAITHNLEKSYQSFARSTRKESMISSLIPAGQQISYAITMGGLIYGALVFIHSEASTITTGSLVAVVLLVAMLMSRITAVSEYISDIFEYSVHHHNLEQMLPPKSVELPAVSPSNYDIVVKANSTTIDHRDDFQQIKIPYGSKVAITGMSAQGKTRWAEKICGVSTQKGEVSLGEVDICAYPESQLRAIIHFAQSRPQFLRGDFQRAVLFDHHLQNHQPPIDTELMAGFDLDVHQLINRSPHHWSDLSDGEIKRLGLYRAAWLKRPVTVVDEPTESLDDLTKATVWKTLFEVFAPHTLICITHDLSVIHKFDIHLEVKSHQITVISTKV